MKTLNLNQDEFDMVTECMYAADREEVLHANEDFISLSKKCLASKEYSTTNSSELKQLMAKIIQSNDDTISLSSSLNASGQIIGLLIEKSLLSLEQIEL